MRREAISFLVFLAVAVPAFGSDAGSVRIEARKEVSDDILTLGALAEEGLPAEVASIRLGYSPYPGTYRWVSRNEVESALSRAGFGSFKVEMPDRILLTRKSRFLAPEKVKDAVLQFFENRLPGIAVEIQDLAMPENVPLPAGEVVVEVDPGSLPRRLDGVTLRINLLLAGRQVQHQWVHLRARATANVVVAARDLEYGRELLAADLAVEKVELDDLEGPLFSISKASGLVAKRAFRQGQVLRSSDLKYPVLVKRGDLVTLVGRTSTLTVTASARAKDSGGLGDRVVVQNLTSNQLVEARIVDAGTVEVLVPEIKQ